MLRQKMKRIKSALAAGLIAASALAAPLPTAVKENVSPISASAADVQEDYARLLQYSLYFYDANMCGTQAAERSQLSWRGDCHTGDDVDGGFHDAGDHVMFGQPQGFAASTLAWGYYEFGDTYDALGQTAHLKNIMDHFCEFFRNSTELDSSGTVSRFCYQKGNGNVDHSYWGAPESQTNSRQQYWTTNSASNIAAEYAAALALNYLNFGNEEDLKYAKALYAFSTKYNSVATDGPDTFYATTSCADEQAWAAGWLYLATGDTAYKNDCASKQQYIGWVHGWENVSLGAACVYAHITGNWNNVNSYLSGQCTNANSYLFMDKWGSARLNTSMQMCALVASKHSTADYTAWCKGQMNYILGNNPADTCFVVGFADNSPLYPHHRAASGTSSAESNAASKYNLVGALVGGPEAADGTYHDSRNDYICNEVALDYNAGFVGAAAGLYEVFGTGALASSIDSAETVYGSDTQIEVTPGETTAPDAEESVSTTVPVVTEDGKATVTLNHLIDRSNDSTKTIHVNLSDYVPYNAQLQKVSVNVSAGSSLGNLNYGCGISMKNGYNSDNWYQEDGNVSMGMSGTVEFSTAEISSYVDISGQFMFGMWWSDSTTLTVDSITFEYQLLSESTTESTTTTTTSTTTTTTTIATTTTTSTTTTTTTTTTTQPETTTTTTTQPETTTTTTTQPETTTTTTTQPETTTTTTTQPETTTTTTTQPETTTTTTTQPETTTTTTTTQPETTTTTTTQPETTTTTTTQLETTATTTTTQPETTTTTETETEPAETTTESVTEPGSETTETEVVYGDVNADGIVNVLDVIVLNKNLLGGGILSEAGQRNADVNKNGKPDAADSLIILKSIIGLIELPEN